MNCGRSHLLTYQVADLEPKKYIRGKFELWYLISFLRALSNSLTAKDQHKRAVIKVQLTHENALEILGGKVPSPSSLNEFLDDNLKIHQVDTQNDIHH